MADDQNNPELEDLELDEDAAEKVRGGSAIPGDIDIKSFSFGSSSSGGTSGGSGGTTTHGPTKL